MGTIYGLSPEWSDEMRLALREGLEPRSERCAGGLAVGFLGLRIGKGLRIGVDFE